MVTFQDSDEENPFGDDVGGNVVSFNDMDPQKMGTGGKLGPCLRTAPHPRGGNRALCVGPLRPNVSVGLYFLRGS